MNKFTIIHNRGFQYAILASILWHSFWFFVVTIDVQLPSTKSKKEMRIFFVGPVLNDDAFNLVIANKPELSKTQYRPSSFLKESLTPGATNMERRQPGDLVSVPLGRTTWNALRGVLPSEKRFSSSEFYDKFSVDLFQHPYPISGPLKQRDILYLPEEPMMPLEMNDEMGIPTTGETVFEIVVNPAGEVASVENVVSSGNASIDLLWRRFVKKWQFMPLNETDDQNDQKGEVSFKYKTP